MTRAIGLAAFAGVPLALLACEGSEPGIQGNPGPATLDSAGIEIVTIPGRVFDGLAEWTVGDPMLSVGADESHPEGVIGGVADATLLADGRLVVGDGVSGRLLLFTADGRFERELGGPGSGPGEFQRVARPSPSNVVGIADAVPYRSDLPEDFEDLTGDTATATVTLVTKEGSTLLASARLQPIAQVSLIGDDWERWGSAGYGELMISGPTPLPLVPTLRAATWPDGIVVADAYRPELRIHDGDGALRRVVRPDLPAVPGASVPPGILARWAAKSARPGYHGLAGHAVELLGAPDSLPSFMDVRVSCDGHLYLELRPESSGDDVWELVRWIEIDPEGRPTRYLLLPMELRLLELRPEKVVGVRRDDLDVESVVVMPIVRR